MNIDIKKSSKSLGSTDNRTTALQFTTNIAGYGTSLVRFDPE
jgi:hypothetical protein